MRNPSNNKRIMIRSGSDIMLCMCVYQAFAPLQLCHRIPLNQLVNTMFRTRILKTDMNCSSREDWYRKVLLLSLPSCPKVPTRIVLNMPLDGGCRALVFYAVLLSPLPLYPHVHLREFVLTSPTGSSKLCIEPGILKSCSSQ
jgi:hypothetical protein